MDIATAVVMEYATIDNPEPGVMRAPTVDEQIAAVERHSVAHGLLVHSDPVVVTESDLPPADLPGRRHGVVCSTLAVLAVDGIVDVELFDRWHGHGLPMGFVIEDLWFTSGPDDDREAERLRGLRTMMSAVNIVGGARRNR